MNKGQYQKYLQSSEWAATRQRRLTVAGSRCEFRECEGWHNNDYIYGERCAAIMDLQVHHLRYNTIGAERDIDLEVLCRFHHLVRHAAATECNYCGDDVLTDDAAAIDAVNEAIAAVGDDISKVTLDDICVHDVCAHCEQKLDD
jgi:hypothetical protein